MRDILTDMSKEAMVAAIEANHLEYHKAFFGTWPIIEIHQDEDMICQISEIPSPALNAVMGANLTPGNADEAIKAVIARYSARNLPIKWYDVSLSSPANLAQRLKAHGFVPEGGWPGMAIDLAVLNGDLNSPPGLVIKRVWDIETLMICQDIFATGFGIPDHAKERWLDQVMSVGFSNQSLMYYYVALLDGEPVATSALVPGAGVAGIYNVATIESARRQGIGAAVTLAPMLEGRQMGYRIAVLEATELGFPVYKRMGFEQYCDIRTYVWKAKS